MRTYYAWYDHQERRVVTASTLDGATRSGQDYTTIRAESIAEATRKANEKFRDESDFHALGGGDLAREECGEP